MHVIEVIGENPLRITEGKYLAEDVNAGEMLASGWCKVLGNGGGALPNGSVRSFAASQDWNDRSILFVRPGGFGDLLFLTPTFRELRRRWPKVHITVASFDRYRPALHGNDLNFADYPVSLKAWSTFDAHIWLENIIEANPEAMQIHAVDVIAKRLGLEFEDKRMDYFVSDSEQAAAESEFPRTDLRRVGLQMTASGSCRVYPYMIDLSKRLWRDSGCEVFLFGKPGEMLTNQPAGIVNLMMSGATFRQSCAILATCDVVVAPDSALVHVAGALDVPCVALYGPFPWKLRTVYAPKTFALQGTCPISPCFHHARPGTGVFPHYGPCAKTGKCEALAAITVERIIREVEKKLGEKHGHKTTERRVEV